MEGGKQYQQEHRPQWPTEHSDPTQHAKGRTGDCPGPRKETTTQRNVTQGGRGQKKVCLHKIGLKFPAPLINFIFCGRTIFLVWGGIGRGLPRPRTPPPSPPKGVTKQWPAPKARGATRPEESKGIRRVATGTHPHGRARALPTASQAPAAAPAPPKAAGSLFLSDDDEAAEEPRASPKPALKPTARVVVSVFADSDEEAPPPADQSVRRWMGLVRGGAAVQERRAHGALSVCMPRDGLWQPPPPPPPALVQATPLLPLSKR